MTEHKIQPEPPENGIVDTFEEARQKAIAKIKIQLPAMKLRREMRKAADISEEHSGGDGSKDYKAPDEKDE